MTYDEILHLAEQVGCGWTRSGTEPALIYREKIVAFAALVAAAEREACAAIMDAIAHQCRMEDSDCEPFVWAAAAIRARGEAYAVG
jgi:hypothetical protein